MTSPQGSLVETALAFVRSRLPVVVVLVVVALIARFATMPAPPERSAEAIAEMLGRAANGTVSVDDFVWEERGSFLHDALIGRRVLFLASHPAGQGSAGGHDLYRAVIRLTRGGRPIAIRRVDNLTATPRGDERDLVAHGHYAAYVTRAADAVSTISLVDLSGDIGFVEAKTRSERLRAYVENWLRTGSWRGLGRAELSFATPPKEAKIELTSDALVLALGAEGTPAAVGLSDETVNPGPRDEHGLRYQRLPHPVTPWPRFAVETARATLGEGAALRARHGIGDALSFVASLRRGATPLPAELLASGGEETKSADSFPPPRLRVQGAKEMPGEGVWMPAKCAPALSQSGPEAPAAFFETAIRPDSTNPGAIVRLVAMDGRRFDLRPIFGSVAPRSETGLHGRGRIAEADRSLAVAVFAASEPEGAASLGAVREGQPLVYPRPSAMTVVVDRFGHSALSLWPFGEQIPTNVRSLRQVSALVVRAGKLEPQSAEGGWLRERSALGTTVAGHWVYAWGKDITSATLGKALMLAGCVDAVSLASSPDPAGFAFLRTPRDNAEAPAELLSLSPEMSWGTGASSQALFTQGSPTELFAVVERVMRPSAPLPEGSTWEPDAGKQPAPSWQPAVYGAKVTKLGVDVRLLLFAPGRFVFRVRAGTKEASHRFGGTFPTTLDEADKARLLGSVAVGIVRRRGVVRGLAIGGAIGLRFGSGAGALVVEGARARIDLSESVTLSPEADAVELPLTANEGHPLPESRVVGSMRPRAALCVREDGGVLVASTTFDTDEATTEALVDAGCGRVVALDRGSHSNALLGRAGLENAPWAESEQTALFVLEGAPMAGGRLGADGLVTATP